MASHSLFSLDEFLTFVGFWSVLWFLLKVTLDLWWKMRTYVLSEGWRGIDLASYGPWAVITGATAGIGKAYAHELAKRGLNVVLVSRSLEKLKQVAAEIEERYGQRAKVIQANFTQGSELYEPVRAALQGLEISILVNNVGMGFDHLMEFLSTEHLDRYIRDLVHCNMLSTVKMTQIVLPQMVARKKGIIINMSSITGRRPFPMSIVYSASKAFSDYFSQALDIEYRSKGIIIQSVTRKSLPGDIASYVTPAMWPWAFLFLLSVLPMFVNTGMTSSYSKWCMSAPETFTHKALNTVGIASRTSGCLSHSFQYLIIKKFFPVWLHLTYLGTWFVSFLLKLLLQE